MRFSKSGHTKHTARYVIASLIILFIILLVGAAVIIRNTYNSNLLPLSETSKTQVVTIEPGTTTSEIATLLKNKNVIRSDWAFEWYVRNEHLRDSLKAGTYVVDQNQSVQQIVNLIVNGQVATDLITIYPGENVEEIKESFIKDYGFSKAEVERGLSPSTYLGHPALTDKPEKASLEGYIYPETFQKTADTTVEDIITLSLDEMDRVLSPQLRQKVAEQGLTLHEAVTLASIIEGEVGSEEDREKVAQVFLKRLEEGIGLESNATDDYSKGNPDYDTYRILGLPPGPISNFTETALTAIAYPAQTDWLYFFSGCGPYLGNTYYNKTLEKHEAQISEFLDPYRSEESCSG